MKPLILFSGLAADSNVFAPQRIEFPQLIVPEWPIPTRDDNLESYAERIAATLVNIPQPIIGGASFGGIVALHVAKYLTPSAVLLIGSVRSPEELPKWIRFARPLRYLLPVLPVKLLQLAMIPLTFKMMANISPLLPELSRQFVKANPRVFKWSLSQMLRWKKMVEPCCVIRQIHGSHDSILPVRNTFPDRLVAGGHVITLTNGAEVNDFIRDAIDRRG